MITGTQINFPNSCEICMNEPICRQSEWIRSAHDELKQRFQDSDRLLNVNLECPFFNLDSEKQARKELYF